MICDTAEEIEDELIRKGVTLELDLEEELAPRPVDENGLHRTLMNLIVNAMEALPEGSGVITASTQLRPDDTLVIRIRDNGTGIQPDVLEKIFLPFFTTKGSKGTGLGLPMCKKVIEDMGGRMDVDSVVNEGTTFTMTIPRVNLTKDIQTGHDTVREEDD
jgi:two-component system sensor histidine kinase HydH